MDNEPQTPSERAAERAVREGLSQDRDNPNRLIDQNGRTAGAIDGDKVKIENGSWEPA